MRRLALAFLILALIACGGDDDDDESAPTATVGQPQAVATETSELFTATTAPTATTANTATVEPTNTREPTATPKPTNTPRPTATPAPTNTATVVPTSTPEPLALSVFQPSLEEFGASYKINDASKITEPPGSTGFVDGDTIQYAVQQESFGSAPLIIQARCVRFATSGSATGWIDDRRNSNRRVLTNVANDQEIGTGAEEAYTLTGLFSSQGNVYGMGHIWFRLGPTACEYQTLDEDSDYLQFVVDLANRVIGRITGT